MKTKKIGNVLLHGSWSKNFPYRFILYNIKQIISIAFHKWYVNTLINKEKERNITKIKRSIKVLDAYEE